MRTTWVYVFSLFTVDVVLLLLAVGNMLQNDSVVKAGFSVGFITAFTVCELSFLRRTET